MIPEFDNGCRPKHSVFADNKLPVLKRVYVAFDEQEVRAALHWKEAGTRDVDTMGVLEVLYCCSSSCFELE